MPERDLWTFYEEVRDFQVALRGEGDAEAADALDRAMKGGATSGEILGDIGVALRKIADGLPGARDRAQDLLVFVDDALRPRA